MAGRGPAAPGITHLQSIADARLLAVVLDGELAVPCTRNPLQRGRIPSRGPILWDCRRHVVLKAGSCAARHREPGQDRKVAALSGTSRVTRGCPAGANERRKAGESLIDRGCTTSLSRTSESGPRFYRGPLSCSALFGRTSGSPPFLDWPRTWTRWDTGVGICSFDRAAAAMTARPG